MRALLNLIFFLALFPTPGFSAAIDGVLDLRGQSWDEPISTAGSWEFYWNQLLTPEDFTRGVTGSTAIRVPGPWSQDPAKFPIYGYATYRLNVQLDEVRKVAFFADASIWSASRIFIDDKLLTEIGQVGTSPDSSIPRTESRLLEFTPKQNRFSIIVQVSNFEIFLCGITIAPELGQLEVLSRERQQKTAADLFIVGSLFIMGMYHACLFLLRREDRSTIFFSLICFCVGLWLSTARNGAVPLFWPNMGFDLRLRVYNLAWMAGVSGFIWFLRQLFPTQYSRKACWLSTGILVSFFLIVLTTRPAFFVNLANLHHFSTVLFMIYTVIVVIRCVRLQLEGAAMILLGIGIPIFTGIHDMLAIREIISSPPLTGMGLFAFIFFQSFLLARRFSKAFGVIRGLSDDLKAANTDLEKKVEEKIRDIRSIMEHIPIGIFMIDQSRRMHRDHSQRIHDIFSAQEIETADVLARSHLDADQRSQAISCLESSLGEDLVNFEVNQHTLPIELQRDDGIFEMTWDAIVNGSGIVDKILVTMRDVTDLRRLQARSQEQQQELEFIGEIINAPPIPFMRFLETSDEILTQSEELLRAPRNPKVMQTLFIHIHTLKGSARSLYLKRLVTVLHDVEQAIAQNPSGAGDLESGLQKARELLNTYRFIARERLGRNTEALRVIEYRLEELEPLYRTLKGDGVRGIPEALMLLHQKIFKDAAQLFEELLSCVPMLAKDLGKQIPHIRLSTDGIAVGQRAEEIFRRVFVHLIRNAMDHGLEGAEERKELGKDPVGTLFIQMRRVDDRLQLACFDDGRGLNLRKLEQIARSKGLLPKDHSSSPAEIAACIFHAGLSTARELSDISGRGIGMHAVQQFIEQNGGHIRVELDPQANTPLDHCGFRLIIDLPFAAFEERLQASA